MIPDTYEIELRDRHLQPLRRFLAGDPEGLTPFDWGPRDADVRAERTLFLAAAGMALRRRFPDCTRGEIIRFVGDLRMSLGRSADQVDAVIAEDLIRAAVGDLSPERILRTPRDAEKTILVHVFILERLRDENIPSDEGMDDFLDDTMDYARTMLASRQPRKESTPDRFPLGKRAALF